MKKVYQWFTSQNEAKGFALLVTFCAFIVGLIGSLNHSKGNHLPLYLTAPTAAYISGYFIWKKAIKTHENFGNRRLLFVSALITVAIHYLNYMFFDLGKYYGYYVLGIRDSLDQELDSIFKTLTINSLIPMIFSLLVSGIQNWALVFICGWLVQNVSHSNERMSRT